MKINKIISFLILVSLLNISQANTLPEEQCMQKWNGIAEQKQNVEQEYIQWLPMSNECGETGFYYYMLASLEYILGKFNEAKLSYQKGLTYESKYENRLIIGLGNVYYLEGKNNQDPDGFQKAEEQYSKAITKFPNWYGGYMQMSSLELNRGNDINAIQYSVKTNELQPSAIAYRNLVIAYQHIGEFNNSLDAMGLAYELDNNMFSEKYMMYSAALSYLNLKKYDYAVNVLATLVKNVPSVKNESDYKKLLEHMKAKIQEDPNYEELREEVLDNLE